MDKTFISQLDYIDDLLFMCEFLAKSFLLC